MVMRKLRLAQKCGLLVTTVVTTLVITTFALELGNMAIQADDPRAPVRLLPGFKMRLGEGWEGNFDGEIWDGRGLSIKYDYDRYKEDATSSVKRADLLWRREQTLGEKKFVFVFTRAGQLVARTDQTNFQAKIRDHQDMAEALLTILTWEPRHGYPVDRASFQRIPWKRE